MSRCRAVVALVILTMGLVGGAAAPAGSQTTRTLTVEPSTELDNQVLEVKWTGFNPLNTVTIFQCSGSPPASLANCYQVFRPPATNDDTGSAVPDAVTAGDGTGSALLEVRPAFLLPALNCTANSTCSIVAFENDGTEYPATGLPDTAATAPLAFARSPSDCPAVATPDVVTGGENSASHALYAWSARVCTGSDPLALDYTEYGSNEARENFLNGLVDIGITSQAATTEELAGNSREFAYAPLDVNGTVVAFNVRDTVTGLPIREMNLTPRLVALLIAGSQSGGPGEAVFGDPEFVAINPGHNWPSNSKAPLLRSERNADTHLVTRWIDIDGAARRFLDGGDPVAEVDLNWLNIDYPTYVFEARNQFSLGNYNPRGGTRTNAQRLFNLQGPGDGQNASPSFEGLFAVIDAVTAAKFKMPVANLRPAITEPTITTGTGSDFVPPDANGLGAGVGAMQAVGQSNTVQANVTAGGGAYPLVKVDYAMVPTGGLSQTKADDISQVLQYASDAGQRPDVLADGYLALPANLRTQVDVVRQQVLSGVEGSTVPPPLSTPPPTFTDDFSSEFPFDPAPSYTDDFASDFTDIGTPADPAAPAGGTDPADPATGNSSGSSDARPGTPSSEFSGGSHQAALPTIGGIGLVALLAAAGAAVWDRFGSRKPRQPTLVSTGA